MFLRKIYKKFGLYENQKKSKKLKKMVKKSSSFNILHPQGGLGGTKLRAFLELFEGLKTPTSYCFLEKSIKNLVSMKIKKKVKK